MSSRVLVRLVASVLAGTCCGVAVTCGFLVLDGPDGPDGPGEPADTAVAVPVRGPDRAGRAAVEPVRAREVLRGWDADRAGAWTAGDHEMLADLYTSRSVAGERDVAMLHAWTDRGARVSDLTTQVLRLQVLVDEPRRLVLVVTDRVARLEVAGQVLPRDRPSTRRITMRRGPDDVWRVVSVSPERPARS